jgi:hypothetical protein
MPCGSCKMLSRTSLQCCYIFSGPSGSLVPALLSVVLSTAQAGARNVTHVALIHYSSYIDSIKTSLQFSCKFVVINASEE